MDLFASTRGAIVAVGDNGAVEYASPAALDLLGWDASLIGRPLTSVIPDRLRPRHLEGFGRYVRTGESRLQGKTVRVPARRQDGTETDIDLTIRVFRRPDGTKLVSAGLSRAAIGEAPESLVLIEGALARRLYQLV